MPVTAQFRFHDALNDFLPRIKRNIEIVYSFSGTPALKDAIEALGIPHLEVDVILVNQRPANFKTSLQPADLIDVYPASGNNAALHAYSLQAKLPVSNKFILDVHLGKLAKSLRLLGFDIYYNKDLPNDKAIAQLAAAENRIVLTRDVGLLKHKEIQRGYWLRSQNPEEQLREIINYFRLRPVLQPFTRCLACNTCLVPVTKEAVWDKIPPKTKLYYNNFFLCPHCERIYWQGSHYENMQAFIKRLVA